MTEHDEFKDQVRTVLNRGADEMDDATLNQLRQARMQAITAAERQQRWNIGRWQLWSPALAATLIITLVGVMYFQPTGEAPMEDLDLLVANDQLEMYEELDFYVWLAELDNAS